jgi:hypothetical protein
VPWFTSSPEVGIELRRHVRCISTGQCAAGFDGMHVPVDDAGHQEAALEVDLDGRWTNVARKRRVVADVEDSSVDSIVSRNCRKETGGKADAFPPCFRTRPLNRS